MMKKLLFATALSFVFSMYGCGGGDSAAKEGGSAEGAAETKAAPLMDFSTESADNKAERTELINLAKNALTTQDMTDFSLEVVSLKVKDGFAFLMANVKNADGSDYVVKDEHADCCHAEALLRKDGGKWISVASNAFSTDMWYGCLWKEKNAPKEIFGGIQDTCE